MSCKKQESRSAALLELEADPKGGLPCAHTLTFDCECFLLVNAQVSISPSFIEFLSKFSKYLDPLPAPIIATIAVSGSKVAVDIVLALTKAIFNKGILV